MRDYDGLKAEEEAKKGFLDKASGDSSASEGPGTNTGHGHIWERPEGIRMRCMPSRCSQCQRDPKKWGGAKSPACLTT